jgi:hypothetical protein
MFTEEYYREKMRLALFQAETTSNENDKTFYANLAQRWSVLLSPEEHIVPAPIVKPFSYMRELTPIELAQGLGETRDAYRLRSPRKERLPKEP